MWYVWIMLYSRWQFEETFAHSHREKTFKCDLYGSCFALNGTLKTNVRTRSGYNPFKCDVCELCFTQGSSLKKHVTYADHALLQIAV